MPHGVEVNHEERLIEGAIRYAQADRSDPFSFSRAMSEIKRGLCRGFSKDGKGYGYDAEPYKTEELDMLGKPMQVIRFKNVQRP